jgi:hypothetical protein
MIKPSTLFQLLCFVFMLSSANLWANNVTESEKRLLVDIFPTSCHFSGQFSQRKNIDGLPVPLLSDGDFFFSCDLGLVWNTYSPFNEAILYANVSKSYRVDDEGEIQQLSGIAKYIMSKVLMRLLKGDADYFVEEFLVTPSSDNEMLELRPESYFMKKGIDNIPFKKVESFEEGVSLRVVVTDITGQETEVDINKIKEHEIDGKANALQQCQELYPNSMQWCKVLRAPRRFNKKF